MKHVARFLIGFSIMIAAVVFTELTIRFGGWAFGHMTRKTFTVLTAIIGGIVFLILGIFENQQDKKK